MSLNTASLFCNKLSNKTDKKTRSHNFTAQLVAISTSTTSKSRKLKRKLSNFYITSSQKPAKFPFTFFVDFSQDFGLLRKKSNKICILSAYRICELALELYHCVNSNLSSRKLSNFNAGNLAFVQGLLFISS